MSAVRKSSRGGGAARKARRAEPAGAWPREEWPKWRWSRRRAEHAAEMMGLHR